MTKGIFTQEIFLIIGNSGLIDKKLCKSVAELMYFRNLLAHEENT